MSETSPPRVSILNVHVSAIDMVTAVDTIAYWVRSDERHYVCVTGVHGIMECQRDARLLQIHNQSGLTTPDGMPMVWAGRWAGAVDMARVYGPDLMLAVCEWAASAGVPMFFYGTTDSTLENLTQRLLRRFPGLLVAGAYSPPFGPVSKDEDDAVIRSINETGAQIVWVGLSTPKQERWMAEHIHKLHANVLLGVGAAFDIHAGHLPQAPRWMQRAGLEWLYRVAREPRRLWRRYLRNIPAFIASIVRSPPRMCIDASIRTTHRS